MSRLTRMLIPVSQRQPAMALHDTLDLARGDKLGKRTGFMIMLVLSAIIAVSGVLQDSTATVIGAMIIAPLGTPILGIALGIVAGHRTLVLRSLGWVLVGLVVVVVVIGILVAALLPNPVSITSNSQISGRTAPRLLDLFAALATGMAGAFAMCRKDLSAVLPGVAISISLVPPLGVVGVCVGQGAWTEAAGAFFLFMSNVVAMVISGSIVFTLAGYVLDPSSSPSANRRHSYVVVAILTGITLVPLAGNTVYSALLVHWGSEITESAEQWLDGDSKARVDSVDWRGLTAVVSVTSSDGDVPPVSELSDLIGDSIPDGVGLTVDVSVGSQETVR